MLNVYTKTCAKNIAGNNAVLVTEASLISSVTVDSNGEVTAITMVASATFKELQADQDSIVRLEEAIGNDSNIAYTHSVQMGFAKGSVNLNTLRDSLADGSPCGIVAIVQDANGKCWLVGYNENDGTKRALRLVQDNYTSGNSPVDEDVQKADIALESVSGYPDLPFNTTLNDSITAALAAGGGSAITWSPVAYGPELATGWNTAAFWNTVGPGWTINEGVDISGVATTGTLLATVFWDIASTYKIVITVADYASGECYPPYDGSTGSGELLNANETLDYEYTIGGVTGNMYIIGTVAFTGKITALSIKKVL